LARSSAAAAPTAPRRNNRVTDDYGTVAGGLKNKAGDDTGTTGDRRYATVGGGFDNTANGGNAIVAGGFSNNSFGQSPLTFCFEARTAGGEMKTG